ncbi:MAG TPA: winged helix-turn-helix transcriptional regulator [Solirubrobacterales bacterium]|nr:winged helix-turn-helix transcriptional regulator [Solirubrobacterales bacterium]
MRLLSAGASGAILMALGDGALRTKGMTERVKGYTPRTVYRYAEKLTALGVIERREEPGVPSKVVHRLSEPSGRELYELVDAYADASLTRLPSGEIDAHAWGSLALLADLWESGLIEELNLGPKSPTELARVEHGLSYHQVNRRAGLFAVGGFLHETTSAGRRRGYSLTDKARRGMALIAGIGRWRRRYIVPEGTTGLTPRELGGLLRTALPLVALPEHGGKNLGIEIHAEDMLDGEADAVWASIEDDGAVLSCPGPLPQVDGRARGKVATLVDAIIDGHSGGLKADGDHHLIHACLERLHSTLWTVWPEGSPTPAEAVAGGDDGT